MKLTLGAIAVGATVLMDGTLAQAAIPIISGDYVSTTRVYCQPTLEVEHSNGAVTSVTGTPNGHSIYSVSVTLESYDPSTGTVKIKGFRDTGSVMLLLEQNNLKDHPFKDTDETHSYSYSNDLPTVTINGIVYHVIWGLRKKEIAQYFVLLNLDQNGCVTQSEKVLK